MFQMPGSNKQFELQGPKGAKALSAVAVGAVLVATLWPLNPLPRNGISWLQGTKGLKFDKEGLVVSTDFLKPPESNGPESYTLELLLRPATDKSSATIFALYRPGHATEFQVRQWFDGLVVTHDSRVESDQTQAIKFDVGPVLYPGKLVSIALSSGPNGTTMYVDGQPAHTFPKFNITRSELSGEIVLGTSPVRYQPWSGEIRGLAIYAKEITPTEALQHYQSWTDPNGLSSDLAAAIARYRFAEARGTEVHNEATSGPDLEIPSTFSVPHKDFLLSPWQEFRPNWHYAWDVATNILGFLPLGVIVCAYLAWTKTPQKAILLTTIFCGMFSFAIEALQYYIPRRGSGVTDIITNTLGAALGATLLQTRPVRRALERMKFVPMSQLVMQCRTRQSVSPSILNGQSIQKTKSQETVSHT